MVYQGVQLGGYSFEDLQYRRLRDAIPNVGRCYREKLRIGADWDYAGDDTYHASLFDFESDMGCKALVFIIDCDVPIDIKFNDDDNMVFRLDPGNQLSLSRWELIISRVRLKVADGLTDGYVNILVTGFKAASREKQAGTV